MKGNSQSTDVSVRKDQLPALAAQIDLEALSGQGLENTSEKSYAIPFLRILQSNSPQVKRTEGAYIPGAQEGMLLNTVTNETIDMANVAMLAIPVYYRQAYVEWKTTEDGGGFVAEHPVNTPLAAQTKQDDKRRDILPNGHQLVDTRYHYLLLVRPDGHTLHALVTMSSTQTKHSKRWMSVIGGIKMPRKPKLVDGQEVAQGFFNPPSFSHSYALGVSAENNDKNSWWGWKIGTPQPVNDPFVFAEAQDFYAKLKSGLVKEATETLAETAPNSAGDADRATF